MEHGRDSEIRPVILNDVCMNDKIFLDIEICLVNEMNNWIRHEPAEFIRIFCSVKIF